MAGSQRSGSGSRSRRGAFLSAKKKERGKSLSKQRGGIYQEREAE